MEEVCRPSSPHCWTARRPRISPPPPDACDLDPTNDRLTDATYVELAHGRDYADVAPLKGVIFADAGEGVMEVAVDMIRVDRG